MTPFQEAVIKVVRAVPKGQVVSYGQVAAYVGLPRAARQVGWILRGMDTADVPWWRVINNAGRISIKGNVSETPQTQKDHLEAEGVVVTSDYRIDMDQYQYVANPEALRSFDLDPAYIQMLITKYHI